MAATSRPRSSGPCFAANAVHWFDDLAEALTQIRIAHEELLAAGDLHLAGFARIALLRAVSACGAAPGHVAQPCPVILLAHAMNFSGSSFAP